MTKKSRTAYAVTILILLVLLIAVTAVLSVMSKRLNKLNAEKDYIIIGIVDPYTGEAVYDDFSTIVREDIADDFSFVLRNVSRGENVDLSDLDISVNDFSCSLRNLHTSETIAVDKDWPTSNEIDPVYYAYELKVEFVGTETEGYVIAPMTLMVLLESEKPASLNMFVEESIYVYPGEQRTYIFTPEYGVGKTVFKTYGGVEHTLTVSDGKQTLYSGESAEESVCTLDECSTVYLTFSNDSDVNEAFGLSAGYVSLSDYIDDPDGIDFTIESSGVYFLQIDPAQAKKDDSTSASVSDILNLVAESNGSMSDISVKIVDHGKGSLDQPLFDFRGTADGFRTSLYDYYETPLIIVLTNESAYEKSINFKMFKDSGTALGSTTVTPKIFTIGIRSINKILVSEPGILTVTFDARMTDTTYVILVNEHGERSESKIESFSVQLEVDEGTMLLIIENKDKNYLSASFTFKAKNT